MLRDGRVIRLLGTRELDFNPMEDDCYAKAQLADVILALLEKGEDLTLAKDEEAGFYEASCFIAREGVKFTTMKVVNRHQGIKSKPEALCELLREVVAQGD